MARPAPSTQGAGWDFLTHWSGRMTVLHAHGGRLIRSAVLSSSVVAASHEPGSVCEGLPGLNHSDATLI